MAGGGAVVNKGVKLGPSSTGLAADCIATELLLGDHQHARHSSVYVLEIRSAAAEGLG